MTEAQLLTFVSQQLHIYYGLFILIAGVLGNLCSILVFTTLRTFRETTCGFYLTIISIVNIGQLIFALLVRILSEGFKTNIRSLSAVCKIQAATAVWCVLMSTATLCLVTIDQYISLSRYRQYSNQRFARFAVTLTCICCSLYCIPFLIYWDAPAGSCIIVNGQFLKYFNYFHIPIVFGFLPLSVMTVFALLAFCKTRSMAAQQMHIIRLSHDRQLTAMNLYHAGFVVITALPYVISYNYVSLQSNTDPERAAQNNLVFTVTILLYYSTFAGAFYIYCCVSERFRKQLLYVLLKMCSNQQQMIVNNGSNNSNRIVPQSKVMYSTQAAKSSHIDNVLVII